MLRKLFNIILLLCLATTVQAQELNCKVRIMRDKIQNVDKEVFVGMERAITEFLNMRKWTTDQWGPTEKIDCNILFNLQEVSDGDVYSGTMNISASRPVYNTSYTTSLVNYIDKDIKFRYSQFAPLQFDDNRVNGNDAMASNLTALLAYYSYLILGLDYDSFSKNGGSDLLKKAQNIVNNAPENGNAITGWKPTETRNRYWLIDNLLSPRFKDYREFWYVLHREALDNMYAKPEESRKLVLDGIVKLSQLQRDNPTTALFQFFFNAKSDEIAAIIAQVPKQQRGIYITMLATMDVPNAQKYNNLK